MLDQVDEISAVVAAISAGAREQSSALSQVNTAVNQMDQATQQNAAMAEESTAAAHSLAGQAQELSRLVAAFRVDCREAATGPIRTPASRKTVPTASSTRQFRAKVA